MLASYFVYFSHLTLLFCIFNTVKSTNNSKNNIYSIRNDFNDVFTQRISNQISNKSFITSNSNHRAPHVHKKDTSIHIDKKKSEEAELLVNTQSGFVRGRRLNLDKQFREISPKSKRRRKYRLNAWLGIPYAEKPIGDRRFKRPTPVKSWDDVKNATQLPNTCYQLPDNIYPGFWGTELWNANTEVSEDCLYLNIWTTSPMPRNSPVLVNISIQSFYLNIKK
jgi:hypothetical protein